MKKKISTRSAKAKGRRLQNLVCQAFRDSASRYGLNFLDCIRPAIMGEQGTDIKFEGIYKELFNFGIECKNQETTQIWKWWEQTTRNTEEGSRPLLVFTRNRAPTLVTLALEDFMELVEDEMYRRIK